MKNGDIPQGATLFQFYLIMIRSSKAQVTQIFLYLKISD